MQRKTAVRGCCGCVKSNNADKRSCRQTRRDGVRDHSLYASITSAKRTARYLPPVPCTWQAPTCRTPVFFGRPGSFYPLRRVFIARKEHSRVTVASTLILTRRSALRPPHFHRNPLIFFAGHFLWSILLTPMSENLIDECSYQRRWQRHRAPRAAQLLSVVAHSFVDDFVF